MVVGTPTSLGHVHTSSKTSTQTPIKYCQRVSRRHMQKVNQLLFCTHKKWPEQPGTERWGCSPSPAPWAWWGGGRSPTQPADTLGCSEPEHQSAWSCARGIRSRCVSSSHEGWRSHRCWGNLEFKAKAINSFPIHLQCFSFIHDVSIWMLIMYGAVTNCLTILLFPPK